MSKWLVGLLFAVGLGFVGGAVFALEAPEKITVRAIFDEASLDLEYEVRWQAVEGARSYRVQCSDDPAFPIGMRTEESPWTGESRYAFERKYFNRRYYFRVKAKDRRGESAWSAIKSTAIASILGIDLPRQPVFRGFYATAEWAEIEGENVLYQVECSTDSAFGEQAEIRRARAEDGSEWISETHYTFDNLEPRKQYFFRVRAEINGEEQRWSRLAYAVGYRFEPLRMRGGVSEGFFRRYIKPGGPVMYALGLCLILGLGFLLRLAFHNIRIGKTFPPNKNRNKLSYFLGFGWNTRYKKFCSEFVHEIEEKWMGATEGIDFTTWRGLPAEEIKVREEAIRKDLDKAASVCKQHETYPLARILGIGVENHRNNLFDRRASWSQEIDRAIENTAAAEKEQMDGVSLNLLWAVGGICPMLGLFGTIVGIYSAFGCLSEAINEGLEMAQALPMLSKGINEALLTTIWGLMLGVPMMAGYYYFKAKSDWIYAKWQEVVVNITTRL